MLALPIAYAPKRLTWLPLVLTTTPQAPSMLLYKAPAPSRHAGISTAVSASQTRLTSHLGLRPDRMSGLDFREPSAVTASGL